MNTLHKAFLLITAAAFSSVMLTSCSTMEGLGADLEKAGNVLNKEAKKRK